MRKFPGDIFHMADDGILYRAFRLILTNKPVPTEDEFRTCENLEKERNSK